MLSRAKDSDGGGGGGVTDGSYPQETHSNFAADSKWCGVEKLNSQTGLNHRELL